MVIEMVATLPLARGVPVDFTMPETFGDWLKRARLARGLSQRELAFAAGIDPSSINKIEMGSAGKRPRDTTVKAIAHALAPEDADEETHARIVAEAMKAAGFQPPGETERVADEDLEIVVHAYEGLPTMDKKRLREFAELLKRANQAASIGGGGETEGDGE